MRKWPIFLFILITIFSCGKTTQDEIDDAVLQANLALGQSNCQGAIDILELLGRQNKNADYLKTLSSAYACRAGYSAITFFTSDATNTTSMSPYLNGMGTYTTSVTTFQTPLATDPKWIDLQNAIDILLYAGGISSTTEPTRTERAKYFRKAELDDFDSQLIFMQMVQLGIYYRVYGNVKIAAGANYQLKGKGTDTNVCFADYSALGIPSAITDALALLPGSCKVTTGPGSSQIPTTVANSTTRRKRMCHGVILLNGLFASIGNVVGSLSGSASTTASNTQALIQAPMTALKAAYPGIGIVTSTINQSLCEDSTNVPDAQLESYFIAMMEGLLK